MAVIGRDATNSYNGNICSIDDSIGQWALFNGRDPSQLNQSATRATITALNIEFLTEFGDLPLLQADVRGLASIDPVLQTYTGDLLMNISEYQKGKLSHATI